MIGMGVFSRSLASAKTVNPLNGRSRSRMRTFAKGRVCNDVSYIDEVVGYVIDNYHPKKIIVYGPAASGYMYQNKEMDMVVIVDGLSESDQRAMGESISDDLARGMRVSCSPIVVTQEKFDKDRMKVGRYAEMAETTGYVAYEA